MKKFTVYRALPTSKGTKILAEAYAEKDAALQRAWESTTLLGYTWAEVWHDGRRVALHVSR